MDLELVEIEGPGMARIKPLPNPNMDDLKRIPIGSEVIIVNYPDNPPEISNLMWDITSMMSAQESLDESDPNDRFDGTFMAYLPPDSHPTNVYQEKEILDRALNVWAHIEYANNAETMALFIRTIIQEARIGLFENPF